MERNCLADKVMVCKPVLRFFRQSKPGLSNSMFFTPPSPSVFYSP